MDERYAWPTTLVASLATAIIGFFTGHYRRVVGGHADALALYEKALATLNKCHEEREEFREEVAKLNRDASVIRAQRDQDRQAISILERKVEELERRLAARLEDA